MADTLDDKRFLRDLEIPLDPDDDVRVTPTGDWPTISGRANLARSLLRRACVSPGTLVHRPDFGGGLVAAVESLGTSAARAAMANQIRRTMLKDPRVKDCKATVSAGTPADSAAPAATIQLDVIARGDETASTFTMTTGG